MTSITNTVSSARVAWQRIHKLPPLPCHYRVILISRASQQNRYAISYPPVASEKEGATVALVTRSRPTSGAKPMKPRTVAQGTRTRNRMDSKGLERRCADLGYSRGVSHALENQIVQ